MNKNLPAIKQDNSLVLSKTKKLITITNKILLQKTATKKPLPTVKESTTLKAVGKISDDPNRAIEFEDNIQAWIDKDTGLMWEVKTRENIDSSYVWSEKDIEKAWNPKNLTDDVKDTFSYVKKLNSQKYGGFDDWRIPAIEELGTIFTKEKNNEKYIKLALSKNTISDFYWSSNTNGNYTSDALGVYFGGGGQSKSSKAHNGYIRCIRLGQ